ncbi:MAG TPA: P-loop NTPase [Gemmatimonadaceae bacterium]|nr:P-loop NTPase [Gemmatimonadaceae bacterium]
MGPHASETTSEHLTADTVRVALREVRYPGLTRDIVTFGMVDDVSVCNGRVKVRLALRTADASVPTQLEARITEALRSRGALSVAVEIIAPAAAPAPRVPRHGVADPWGDRVRLTQVRHVVAVGAGKGGVGKSTVAVNLALALARDGLRAGLLDADIYGPSLPILLGIEDGARLVRMSKDKHILPLAAHGLPIISFGFFLGEGSPAIWRGPMVSKAVKQFARGVEWPELDVLVVDLPPGTGDVPLSLAQAVEISGALVVMQPPRVAAAEARKAAEMFRSLEVPMLGLVENMTGAFGRGAGRALATEMSVPFLGDIPFDPCIVEEGDGGVPTMIARPSSPTGAAFDQVARGVATALGWRHIAAGADARP